jgi:plastocyanin
MEPTTPTPPQAPQPIVPPAPTQPTQPAPPPETPVTPQQSSSKALALLIVVLLIVVVAAVAWAIFHKKTAPQPATKLSQTFEVGTKQTEVQLGTYKRTATIQVTANGPLPSTLTVPTGTKIIWQNIDSASHEIAISPNETVPNQFLNNRVIPVGGGYPYVDNWPGTIHYYYVDNPTLTGVVVVQ